MPASHCGNKVREQLRSHNARLLWEHSCLQKWAVGEGYVIIEEGPGDYTEVYVSLGNDNKVATTLEELEEFATRPMQRELLHRASELEAAILDGNVTEATREEYRTVKAQLHPSKDVEQALTALNLRTTAVKPE